MTQQTPKLKQNYHKANFDQRVKYDRWMYIALLIGVIIMAIAFERW